MHSSRAAFSSLQTQQGLGFAVLAAASAGLFEAARLLIWRESEAGGGGIVLGLGIGVACWNRDGIGDWGWEKDILAAGADIVAVVFFLLLVYAILR